MKKLFLVGILITILCLGVVANSPEQVPLYDVTSVRNMEDHIFNGEYPADLKIIAVKTLKDGDYRNRYEVQIKILVHDRYSVYADYPVRMVKSSNVRVWGNTSPIDHPYSGDPIYRTDGEGEIMMWAELLEGENGYIHFDVGGIVHNLVLEYM